MSFNSISRLIKQLETNHPQWESYRQHQLILRSWYQVVSPQVAKHSRPLYLNRGVLSVATASAAWAQTLSLQRYKLIQKLSPLLPEALTDIRFSTVQWVFSVSLPETPTSNTTTTESEVASDECPRCQAFIKPFEIERWGVCGCCMATVWSNKS